MNEIDIQKLQHSFLEADSELRAQRYCLSTLEQENKHLRQVIEMLITSKAPTL